MKKNVLTSIATLFVLLQFSFAQEILQKSVSVTVYNDNLGVVKDLREVKVPDGITTIKVVDVAQMIDPTSVHIRIDGEVLEQNYQYDLVSLNKILQKYIEKEIRLIGEKDELIEGKLLSIYGGQIVVEKRDGGLLMIPDASKYRFSVAALPEGLITKPTLVWTVNSNTSSKQDVEISYQTSGMKWHAEYVAVLNEDDSKIDLNSWVSIENNSGTTYKNANLKLVAGDVHRATQPRGGRFEKQITYAAESDAQFAEQEFFEYHIYKLQRKATVANNETKQISLFESEDVDVNKKYLFRSNNYGGGESKVAVIVELKNSKENNLGVPMPKGKVRVYKSDGESIEFVGEDWIDHTPKNEKVKLTIGNAFDVVASEKMTDHKKITNRIYEQTWEIKLSNRKNEDIIVDVQKALGLNWEILKKSYQYEKENAQTVLFKIPVKKDSTTELTFTVRYNN